MASSKCRFENRRNSRRRSSQPASVPVQDHPEGDAASPRAGLRRAHLQHFRSADARADDPAVAARSRAAGRYRLRVDSPGRPGHRALGRRLVCAEPDVLRSREHREAGDRRRLQRRRVDARRARIGGAEIRAQDSVPVEAEPQRVPLVSECVRSDQVRLRDAGVRDGRAGRGRDDLLRVGRVEAADRGSVGVLPGSARARHVHRAVVLSAQPGVQDEGQGLPRGRRPDRPGESPRRDDRGRHHQAEAAGEQRRLQRA